MMMCRFLFALARDGSLFFLLLPGTVSERDVSVLSMLYAFSIQLHRSYPFF